MTNKQLQETAEWLADSLGIGDQRLRVSFSEPEYRGWYGSAAPSKRGYRISVSTGLSGVRILSTLAHELAHVRQRRLRAACSRGPVIMDYARYRASAREVEARCVSCVTVQALLGIPLPNFNRDNWEDAI